MTPGFSQNYLEKNIIKIQSNTKKDLERIKNSDFKSNEALECFI